MASRCLVMGSEFPRHTRSFPSPFVKGRGFEKRRWHLGCRWAREGVSEEPGSFTWGARPGAARPEPPLPGRPCCGRRGPPGFGPGWELRPRPRGWARARQLTRCVPPLDPGRAAVSTGAGGAVCRALRELGRRTCCAVPRLPRALPSELCAAGPPQHRCVLRGPCSGRLWPMCLSSS